MDKKDVDKIERLKNSIDLYFISKTYVNVVIRKETGDRYYNGFIVSTNDSVINFFDIIKRVEFPIVIDSNVSIDVSTKENPNAIMAKKIWEEYKNGI